MNLNSKITRRHDVQAGFNISRFGVYVFAREYWKYHVWHLLPTIAVAVVDGYDWYIDIEVKFLFVGFGIRFIKIKSKIKEKTFGN